LQQKQKCGPITYQVMTKIMGPAGPFNVQLNGSKNN
jgi:hypothetical protein